MQLIISKATNYNKDKVFFSKTELQIILQTYSKQVSLGVCRDYSIDHIKQKVISAKRTNLEPTIKNREFETK